MSEDRLEDERKLGADAEYLLDHPIYKDAVNRLRDEIMQQWRNAPARDAEGRERLWVMLKLLERIEAHIATVAQTGRMASKQIADIENRRRFFGA